MLLRIYLSVSIFPLLAWTLNEDYYCIFVRLQSPGTDDTQPNDFDRNQNSENQKLIEQHYCEETISIFWRQNSKFHIYKKLHLQKKPFPELISQTHSKRNISNEIAIFWHIPRLETYFNVTLYIQRVQDFIKNNMIGHDFANSTCLKQG